MVFHLDLQKQAASGKNKRQAEKTRGKREKTSGKAEIRSRERLLFLYCRIFLGM